MYKKVIYLISFVVAMSVASLAYGGDVLLSNFEGGSMDGWGQADTSDANIALSFSTNGATLDGNSLKIADVTPGGSGTGRFKRAVTYSMVALNEANGLVNEVNDFMNHTSISIDVTRLASDWGGQWGGWNGDHTQFTGFCEFHMIIEAGRDVNDLNGPSWTKGWDLPRIANWGSWNGDTPKTIIWDYSTLLSQIDFNNIGYLGIILATNWGNYASGGVYYIDNVKLTGGGIAYAPSPANHSVNVQGDPNLSWTPGAGAVTHDVYVGTNFNDVNEANRTSHPGLLYYSQSQASNYCDPGILQPYTTYYWRIDEVNGVNIQKGAVWDFMTAYTGMGVVVGDWENGMNGWEATWQGNTTFSYSTNGATIGNYTLGVKTVKTTNAPQDPGYWIIKRDGVLDLNNMKLQIDVTLLASEWSGQTVTLGPLCVQADLPHSWSQYRSVGPDSVTVGTTNRKTGGLAGETWSGGTSAYRTLTFDLTGPTSFESPAYTHTDWGNATKMTILIALQNGAQGPGKFYLDNVRLVNIRLASNPRPTTLATDINTTPTLGWTKGKDATSHDVYFGTDETAVTNATKTSDPCGVYKTTTTPDTNTNYVPGLLEKGKTYYWRIDENGAAGSPWKGLIWRFTTAEYVFVEDYESYTNVSPKRIFDPNGWIKGGGGKVGYDSSDYAEVTIVHGGMQSMPFDYNNLASPYDSNATRTFTSPQDWTAESVKSLELWCRGWPASVGSFTGSDPYTITATGEDIWNVMDLRQGQDANITRYHDEFHYAYKQITAGDDDDYVTIIAKVNSISDTSPWAKAGVMVRKSLDPNSRNGFMCITPEMGAAWQYRENDSNVSISYDYYTRGEDYSALKDINAPYWVKLVIDTYNGNGNVEAYYSVNGTNWYYVTGGNPVITLPFYVGLAVTAHNAAATCTAGFSNVSIIAGAMSSWNHQDIGIKSNIAAPLYVTLQDDNSVGGDAATVTYSDPNIALQSNWQAWDIALNDFKVNNPSLNLEKIKKITLGVWHRPADPCGKGTLYFDDIRLYPPRCMPGRTPDFNGDCFVDYNDLRILANNWLSSPADPNIDLNKDSKINFNDFAIFASEWLKAALWP
ncbi:MAG: hypothetical protein ABSE89_12270 [Sedimentisphaerales bacterium]